MCCASAAASWSRLALLLGLAATVLQALSLFTGSWLVTREVLAPPEAADDAAAAAAAAVRYGSVIVHTRVGLLRTCVRVEKINASSYPYSAPQPSCFAITTNVFQEVTSADLGIHHGAIQSTAQVVTNVRQYTLVMGSVALALMLLGELSALVSHFKPSFRFGIVMACYLYLFAGLIVCMVVVTFSMITEVPRRDPPSTLRLPAHKVLDAGAPFAWELGTSYYLAVAAFALTHVIAAVLVTVGLRVQVSAFMKRFSSLEAMVREVVPGADRKLREHQNNLVGLWEIYPSRAMRQLGCINLPGAMGCYGKLASEGRCGGQGQGHGQGLGGGERAGEAKPDICSSNPESSVDSLQQQLQQHLQADEGLDSGQDHQVTHHFRARPVSPFESGSRSVSLGQPMSLTAGNCAAQASAAVLPPGLPSGLPPPPDNASLAGVSVPITVMRPRPIGHPGVTIPCGAVEEATPLDTFPSYAAGAGVAMDGTMTVARRKPGPAGALPPAALGPAGAVPGPAAFSTLDNRSRCASARLHSHTNTLPHPPRQF
ncbi:hypothetical protein ONE63_008907 [Megalurothrips usitatus]|uniref:Uncharacterized protein n=1 Tax=Megalurothrips usitatus TaxID=439358 RepID=A0AAV7XPU1_9NEOP|nr:hypothetical protein ONE63_008907 [Megalurothrips usitatus]